MTLPWKRLAAAALAAVLCLAPAAQAVTADQLKELLSQYYINDLPQQALDAETVEDVLRALGDPYTMYMDEEEYRQFLSTMNDGTLVGIGITAVSSEQGLRIVGVYDGSPAQALGLQPGDQITNVDGNAAAGQTAQMISGWLRGPEGSKVTFTVLHPDGRVQTYTAVRSQVVIPATATERLEGGSAAVITCTSFGQETQSHFVEGTQAYDDVNVWVVDLRANAGGDVYAATQAAGVFLGTGTMAYLRSHDDSYVRYVSEQDHTTLFSPILLVSEETASSAEIFAQAVKDHDGGMIIGSSTFGKGVAQIILTREALPEVLSDGGALRITAFQAYGTSGNTTHRIGVIPDLLVPAADAPGVSLLFTPKEPAGSREGWLRADLGGSRWYVDLSQGGDEETAPYLTEMLNALPPGCRLFLGGPEGWRETDGAEAAAAAGLAGYAPRRFSDVADLPCQKAADTLLTYGILQGAGDGLFHPEGSLTRAELAALLVQAMHLPAADWQPDFTDVPPDSWYAPHVKAVRAAGFMDGVGGNAFAPLDTVTHEQLLTVLSRLAAELNMSFRSARKNTPADPGLPAGYSGWSAPWVWLLDRSQTNYFGQTLSPLYAPREEIDPQAPATRSETALTLYNIFWMTDLIKY